jgi:hypothetical protein
VTGVAGWQGRRLPEPEHTAWRKPWAEVDDLLRPTATGK